MSKTESPGRTLMQYLERAGLLPDAALFQEGLTTLIQLLMEFEVARSIEAAHYERSRRRLSYRNGYRERRWRTRFGELRLRIPKLRQGTYYPSFLEADGKTERILLEVLQDALVLGAQMDRMEAALHQLDLYNLTRSDIGDLCVALDDVVSAYRSRPLDKVYPYIWLDALHVQIEYRSRSQERVIALAVGMAEDGTVELLGYELGASADDQHLWQRLLRDLAQRGAGEVQLVTSNAFNGVKRAVQETFIDARWQYCRACFLHDLLTYVPAGDEAQVTQAVSRLFIGSEAPADRLRHVVSDVARFSPRAAMMLLLASEDLLVYRLFPAQVQELLAETYRLETRGTLWQAGTESGFAGVLWSGSGLSLPAAELDRDRLPLASVWLGGAS